VDESVINALQAALAADPANQALRLHLAGVLHAAGNHRDALDQVTQVLAAQPDNLDALKLAAETAEGVGEKIRALGYRKLHEALSWNSAKNLIETAPEKPQDAPEPMRLTEAPEPIDEPWETERPEVTLADVAGMEQVKKRLHTSFLGPMRNPDLRKLYGKSLRGGLLLYGPPGCGKTFIARAVAGELGAGFLAIGLNDVVDMYVGQSEKNLHEIFSSARRSKPCVLFIDELDALGRKRSLMRHHAGTSLINQLLAELDGAQYDNDGVYFLAATNHPWDVDSALRRPGRLDRMLLVLPPDGPAREAMIKHAIRDRPTENIDARALAERTEDFSGADVVHLCDSAAEFALEDSVTSGVTRPIQMGDFKNALKEVKPSTRTWLDTARNHAIYANEGGIYDDLLAYLKKRRML
jgi:SpoVK/Ycf46/Vps4 family AAA+-type ATPase